MIGRNPDASHARDSNSPTAGKLRKRLSRRFVQPDNRLLVVFMIGTRMINVGGHPPCRLMTGTISLRGGAVVAAQSKHSWIPVAQLRMRGFGNSNSWNVSAIGTFCGSETQPLAHWRGRNQILSCRLANACLRRGHTHCISPPGVKPRPPRSAGAVLIAPARRQNRFVGESTPSATWACEG